MTRTAISRAPRLSPDFRVSVPESARELYGIPSGYEALTGLAIGYLGEPERLPDEMRDRDLKRGTRQTLGAFLFADTWGKPAPFVA